MRALVLNLCTVLLGFFLCLSVQPVKAQVKRQIHADLKSVAGNKSTVFNECIGAGRANEGLRADWQQQLAMIQKDVHFKYIRFHGLLHDDMRIYSLDKTGKPVYNFQYVDRLYDFLLSINIRPFVEFGFMPPDMASGTKTIFWWKANVSKPKSYTQWDTLITKLVKHWQQRYGEEEVKKWYFEVWNEPDLKGFFDGTQADYFELYAHTVKAVKSVSRAYRVGGPATSATKWIAEFLSYCENNRLPVDFVSTHDYGTTSVLDEMGTKKQQLKSIRDTIAIDVKRVRAIINASAYKKAELHFTEWNTSPSSRDPIHDTYQNAAYILHVLKKAAANSNSMSYWTFTDVFEEAGPGPTPFHGGVGLINLQDIKKPGYHAYHFMKELGNTELKNEDESSYVCKSEQGVQALIWNYTHPLNGYSFNQDYFNKVQPPATNHDVRFSVANLRNGTYLLEEYRVGYGQNDPYTAYLKMGKPEQLSRAEVSRLKQLSSGAAFRKSTITVSGGKFEQLIRLSDNEIVFLKLIRHL
ncbi:xylan 1,4-beta-xylosidase [Pedobacter sp. AK017]|uniref:GH39 family glycosyl hydrolase n=1 Tax=Pedobacter sp. AK017 TaxID=2723073 RepID=UPI001619C76D|nr:glycoside hydrolase [Pedobacter sp. AK017]MBB5439004.1 xylan 1,4-beta-xylosidase [Pedobacter sp. AK017]